MDDIGWVIPSDKPVQIDWEETQNGKTSYCSYFPWRTAGNKPNDEREFGGTAKNGSVKISASGVVTIVIINHSMTDQYQRAPYFFNKTIILKPNNEGTYIVQ